jgi:microcystin-dependent protein
MKFLFSILLLTLAFSIDPLMAQNQKASDKASEKGMIIPVGTIMAFAGSTIPSGWLLCDGTDISTTTYAKLYVVIGNTYNTQINPTTGNQWVAPNGFRLPDYRGSFLRGVGTSVNGSATTLAGWQTDQFQEHSHNVIGGGGTGGTNTKQISGLVTNAGAPSPINLDGYLGVSIDALTGQGGPRTGTETRPSNKGVNYIIKY